MKDEIILNLDNPARLEQLYRTDRQGFRRAFKDLYPDLADNSLMAFWNARLSAAKEEVSWGSSNDILFVIIGALVAGLIAKLPAMLNISEEFFYSRNVGFIIFPVLMFFYAWKNKLSAGKIAFMTATTLFSLIFINTLADVANSDVLTLSCIHLLLLLWSVLGFAFVGGARNDAERRLAFLRYNGDLLVMSALILIAGGILTGVTIGLFELIGFSIEKFYFDYVIVFGLPAVPILATALTQGNPQLVGRVSPVIARIFSPLVLVMLVVYLLAIVYSGKDPYNDREFLLIFNLLLVGVMAIIFFCVAETSKVIRKPAEVWLLFPLSVITIIVNGIALSAILFRISEWGITPNRLAVLGSNALILINLLMVTVQLYKVFYKKADISGVAKAMSAFLPVYFLWAAIVTFLFPLVFGL